MFDYTFFTSVLHSHHIRLPMSIHLETWLVSTFSKEHQYCFHTVLFISINNLVFLNWSKLENFISEIGSESLIRIDHLQELVFYYLNIFFIFKIYFNFFIVILVSSTILCSGRIITLRLHGAVRLWLVRINFILFLFNYIFYSLNTSFLVSLNYH